MGEENLAVVREKAYNINLGTEIRRTRGKGEIALHFSGVYEKMLGLRTAGAVRRIEFVGWR